jgi:hypothetical protein
MTGSPMPYLALVSCPSLGLHSLIHLYHSQPRAKEAEVKINNNVVAVIVIASI